MLGDFDWADRMAIPVTFIQAVGQPNADRERYGATATLYGGLPTMAGIILGVTVAPLTGAVLGLAGAGLGVAAAASDKEEENA